MLTRSILRPKTNSFQLSASQFTLSEQVRECAANVTSPNIDLAIGFPNVWAVLEWFGGEYTTPSKKVFLAREC